MTNTEPRNPFTKRGFIAAAIVVGVILLAALIVLVTSLTRPSTNDATPTGTPSPTAAPTENADDASVCGLPGFDIENTLTATLDTKWELVGTIAAPTDSTGAGPGTIDNEFRSCYAHTAKGALYMAANFIAMGTDSTFGPRMTELVAPGPGRDAAAEKSNTSTSSPRAQLAGFKIGSYSAEESMVDLVLNYSDGSLVSIPLKLVWTEGDWKVQLTDAGEPPLAPAQLENLGGYTPWSGA
ncbi:hypothetical protein [Cryobacterium psychrophilum]|uniref:DUF8175 domain-containing protein n=1 Tax=Cryobacterium psychrophilum TaxID=41988 RepID=A0A4Y8KPT9_9MICO|nr:hypothetical protein [Cryobacterium psychrophilum]TDW26988.1 hypothetical protein EDD25_3558 [Cryobacterium psychrophilum]TFD75297.1 hypothetical protein E3T53_15945 [Cryobacterium psychrophilum]